MQGNKKAILTIDWRWRGRTYLGLWTVAQHLSADPHRPTRRRLALIGVMLRDGNGHCGRETRLHEAVLKTCPSGAIFGRGVARHINDRGTIALERAASQGRDATVRAGCH